MTPSQCCRSYRSKYAAMLAFLTVVLACGVGASANPLDRIFKTHGGSRPASNAAPPSPAAYPAPSQPSQPVPSGAQANAASVPVAPGEWSPPPGAAKRIPDVLGVRTGMTAEEAIAILKRYDATGRVSRSDRGGTFVNFMIETKIDGKPTYDSVALEIAPPPLERVMNIARGIGGKPLIRATVLAQLQEKYGPGKMNPMGGEWYFDNEGHPVAECFRTPPRNRKSAYRLCDGYVVTAAFDDTGEVVRRVTTNVYDLALAKKAKEDNAGMRANQNAERQRKELESAQTNKPTF
jgi:hypothetical protein